MPQAGEDRALAWVHHRHAPFHADVDRRAAKRHQAIYVAVQCWDRAGWQTQEIVRYRWADRGVPIVNRIISDRIGPICRAYKALRIVGVTREIMQRDHGHAGCGINAGRVVGRSGQVNAIGIGKALVICQAGVFAAQIRAQVLRT